MSKDDNKSSNNSGKKSDSPSVIRESNRSIPKPDVLDYSENTNESLNITMTIPTPPKPKKSESDD